MAFRAITLAATLAVASLCFAQDGLQTPITPGTVQQLGLGGPEHGFDKTGTITGFVLTLEGRPVRDAQMQLRDTSTGAMISQTSVRQNGSFSFENVPMGKYEVVATSGVNEAREIVTVDHGDGQVTLRIAAPVSEPGSGSTVSVKSLKVKDKARSEFLHAEQAFHKGKLDEAKQKVGKALEVDPDYAEALTLRGILYINDARYEDGVADFQHAIKQDPNYAMAPIAMGAALNHQAKFQEAQRSLERGIQLNPASWQAYFELAKCYMGQNDYRSALKNAVKAESMMQEYAPIYLVKANALLGLKEYADAATELERYLSKDSSSPTAADAKRALDQARAFTAEASEK